MSEHRAHTRNTGRTLRPLRGGKLCSVLFCFLTPVPGMSQGLNNLYKETISGSVFSRIYSISHIVPIII